MGMPVRDQEYIARMRLTLDLFEAAESMMRQNLRRRFPRASDSEIERRLVAWLRKQPYDGPIETVSADPARPARD